MDNGETVHVIDSAIRQYPWMDFEVIECSRWKLRVSGALDPSGEDDIQIEFKDIAAVSLPTEWKTDTNRVTFAELTGEAAVRFNLGFRIERGYTLFQFVAEDCESPCVVAAKSVSFQHKVKPE